MDKKYRVILLPINKKSPYLIKKGNICLNKKGILEYINQQPLNIPTNLTVPQYLYILSDEKIKKNDWIINGNIKEVNHKILYIENQEMADAFNKIAKMLNSQVTKDFVICKKIIITNNSSLKIKRLSSKNSSCEGIHEYSLPSISKLFMNDYVSEYNKGNKIEEVLVEYCHLGGTGSGYIPKINPKDNTVIIKKIEI